VKVTGPPFSVRAGRLSNLSVSGAFIRSECPLRLMSRIQVAIEIPHLSRHEAPVVAAYVARKTKEGVGIEWCEFSPPDISRLLQSFTSRRHVRSRKHEPLATVAVTRLSAPLLKHGE